MLQKITKAPTRFYQLLLLNVGLIIGLCKEMSLIGLVASLVFIALAVAPIALYLGILSPPPHQIIQDEVCQKLKDWHSNIRDYISKWQHF